jgi:thiamine biosynthesis lipoprotein ApbE
VEQPAVIQLATHAMGTRFELVLDAKDMDPSRLRAIGEAVIEEVLWWHGRLSAFEASSVVAALNRAAGTGVWTPIDARLERAIRQAEAVRALTDGALDICWKTRREGPQDRVEVEAGRARLTRAGQVLDLGCVGKGLALEAAAEMLSEHGLGRDGRRALVHGGTSSVLAMGAWRVAVRMRDADATEALELLDQHLSVSSNVHRAHVATLRASGIDTRAPVRSAAVIAPVGTGVGDELGSEVGAGGMLAELWSTAIVAGADAALAPRGLTVLTR